MYSATEQGFLNLNHKIIHRYYTFMYVVPQSKIIHKTVVLQLFDSFDTRHHSLILKPCNTY